MKIKIVCYFALCVMLSCFYMIMSQENNIIKDLQLKNKEYHFVVNFTDSVKNLNWDENDALRSIKSIEIDNSEFFNEVKFQDSTNVQLDSIQRLYFSNSIFHDNCFFDLLFYRNNFNVENCIFRKNVNFTYSSFEAYRIYFEKNDFRGKIDFDTSIFRKVLDVKNCIFKEKVTFDYSIFDTLVFFNQSKFYDTLSFRGCSFSDRLRFDQDTLPYFLDLSEITNVGREIDLINTYPPLFGKCELNLINSDISKIKFQIHNFKLWFPDTISYDVKASIYEDVLKNFLDNGFTESYEIIDKEYSELKFLHRNTWFSILSNYTQKYWWDYGYKKERVFLWIVGFLLIFTLITATSIKGTLDVYKICFIEKDYTEKIINSTGFSKFINTIRISFLYTLILFFALKLDFHKIAKTNICFYYILLVYVVGIVCYGFILNIIAGK